MASPSQPKRKRMSAEERRESILEFALPIFALNGFANTSTKEIAKAAQVSEGLLFKHFSSKRELYDQLEQVCCRKIKERASQLSELEPSTSTLVIAIYAIMYSMFIGLPGEEENVDHTRRLLVSSFLQNGNFAREFLARRVDDWIPHLEKSIAAALENGDLVAPPFSARFGLWLAHHLVCGLELLNMPEKPVVDYGLSPQEQLDQGFWFVLRGLGLTDEAIATYYNPESYRMMITGF